MANINKYVTIEFKNHQELNAKIAEFNNDGWEVVSIFETGEKNKKSILLKKENIDSDKQILNG